PWHIYNTFLSLAFIKLTGVRKVLLLGSTGILGSQVLKQLTEDQSYELGVLLRSTSNSEEMQLNASIKVFEGDILNKISLEEGFEWADIVVNCTGKVSYKKKDRELLHAVHVIGTQNITETAAKYDVKLLHTSSACVYAYTSKPYESLEDDMDRDKVYRTKSAYYITKYESEQIILKSPVAYIIVRPSSLVHEGKSSYNKILGFLRKGWCPCLGGGASFVEVTDVAKVYPKAIDMLLLGYESPSIFNLGGQNLSFQELCDHLTQKHQLKCRKIPQWVLAMVGMFNDFILDPLFNKSFLTHETVKISANYSFLNSERARKSLNFVISPVLKK
ncbi:MAG: NAD-dependent epimerase/dehydratase family protein, partial [Bacteroidales bacterium]|nr:NAD-dependent epimerase/dehydratase family protein [Bacteroidales bacterium]